MAMNIDILEKRYDRIEDAIERIVEVSSNLNKMIAVHEEKFKQQEKQLMSMEDALEKRRDETEVKLKDVYETIRTEDKNIIEEISEFREETKNQHSALSDKISNMEKIMWIYMGGVGVLLIILENFSTIVQFFEGAPK